MILVTLFKLCAGCNTDRGVAFLDRSLPTECGGRFSDKIMQESLTVFRRYVESDQCFESGQSVKSIFSNLYRCFGRQDSALGIKGEIDPTAACGRATTESM